MSRRAIITRNINMKLATVKVCNSETDEVSRIELEIPASLNPKQELEYINTQCDNRGVDFIKVMGVEIKEVMYGVYLEDFMKIAKRMTQDRKFIDDPAEGETDDPAEGETDDPAEGETDDPAEGENAEIAK